MSGTSGLYNDAEAIFHLAQQYGFLDELSALTHNDAYKAEKGREAEVNAIKNGTRQLPPGQLLLNDFLNNPEKYEHQVDIGGTRQPTASELLMDLYYNNPEYYAAMIQNANQAGLDAKKKK